MITGLTSYNFLDILKGRWSIKRHCNESFVGKGEAIFEPEGTNCLCYKEELNLTYQDVLIEGAYQQYVYTFENDKVFKYFTDSRLFYELKFEGGSAYGKHICGCDLYIAKYGVEREGLFVEYFVKGPRKDYKLLTTFAR